LIIFDEIQLCPRALTSLKYFNEQKPEYHIIGAGSLLGVAINREKSSFPVGNVDSLLMFPMDFEEFLWAMNEEKLIAEIRYSFETNEALPEALHIKAMNYYRQYLIIGGMPKAILEFIETGNFLSVPEVQSQIINDYIADMAKYATNAQNIRIRASYNSIPLQLAKDNRKFQYKVVQKGGTAAIFGEAIEWLIDAGIVLKCEKVEQGMIPLSVYRDLASFKLYMGDIGLLAAKSGVPQQILLIAGETENIFLGHITENYVAQALNSNKHNLYYWTSNGEAELDFVLQKDNDIIPIEVKTGIHTRSKSLTVFTSKYQTAYSVRISGKNFGFANNIKSVPLYAVFCI